MGENIWKHPTRIIKDALLALEEELEGYYNIADIVHLGGFSIFNKIDGEYVPCIGFEHFSIDTMIRPRDQGHGHEHFIKEIVKPAMKKLAEKIRTLKGDYASIPLDLPEDSISARVQCKNISIRMVKGYDMETMSSVVTFDIALVEIKGE